MNKSIRKYLSITLSVLPILLCGNASVYAAAPSAQSSTLGNDISWPQCNKRLPTGQAFGIVGVNDGLANNTNPCFATELAWAQKSIGGTGQDKVALYVNTANPGLAGSYWPTSNTDYFGTISNPYGTCDGSDSPACAYIYGYAKAYDDVHSRGVAFPGSYLWWLDVETTNSWETNTVANTADLEGMTAAFHEVGARIGIYSTSYQWGVIAGQLNTNSPLNSLPSWIPGASNASGAKANCSLKPLNSGGTVTLTQFVSKNLDYDVSCI